MKTLVVILLVALAFQAGLSQAKSIHSPTSEVFFPSRSLGAGLVLSAWTVDSWQRRRRNWIGPKWK